jgi:hypothetical protein
VDQPAKKSIDLSSAETWNSLRPGMMRSEVVRALEAAGAEISEDDTDPEWMLAMWDEGGFELFFAGEGEQPLRQIILDDEESLWGGQEIIGEPLHKALAVIGDAASGAGWRPECAADERFADLNPSTAGPFADESLLDEGTLWLPRRNLGLVMCSGMVNVVIWRRPEDFPRQLVGSVTEAQKQITARPDCEEYLRKRVSEISSAQTVSEKNSGAQNWLILAFLLVLALLGWQAFLEHERWQTAGRVLGKVTGIVETPGKLTSKAFRVSFPDRQGVQHTVDLEPGEFYVAPTAVGEEVELAFVEGNPPRVMGLSRVRDAAFLRYVPWFIAAAAGYTILAIALRFVERQRRAQEGVVVTPVLPGPGGKP